MRVASVPVLAVLVAVSCPAQNSTPESQALQSLVNEVHSLRMELRTITVASQRVQIVLYRLQAQEATVARASQQLSDARAHLSGVQDRVRDLSTEIKMLQDRVDRAQTPNERKEFEDALAGMRPRLENLQKEEQQQQQAVSEADTQLRNEQRALGELRSYLDQLDKVLEGAASAGTPH